MRYSHLMSTLKTVLRARGWTYARLGEAIGLSESGVKKIFAAEDGSFDRVVRVCEVLGLSLDDLLALVDVSPEPWKITEAQTRFFRKDPRCWWFLQELSSECWDPAKVADRHDLTEAIVEGWLAGLERHGIIRRTESGTVHPDAAAMRPWQGRAGFGEAVIAPLQDALVAHARDRITRKDAHPYPGLTECGFGRMELSPESIADFKQALRDVVSEFASRSRRERSLRDRADLVPVGVVNVMAPFTLPTPDLG